MAAPRPAPAPAGPAVDHRAEAKKKAETLENYRAGSGAVYIPPPVINPAEPGGIVGKIKALEENKEMADEWKKLMDCRAFDTDPELKTFLEGPDKRAALFAGAKQKVSDDVKAFADKSEVKSHLEPDQKAFIAKLQKIEADPRTTDEVKNAKEAAKKLREKYEAELPKICEEHYDAEMKRLDTSLGLQKQIMLSYQAAEKARHIQNWWERGWFPTNDFPGRRPPGEEKKGEGMFEAGISPDLERAMSEFRKSSATRYNSKSSPYYMEISKIEKDAEGNTTKCTVRAVLKPGEKDNEANRARRKSDVLTFLTEKTGCDSFTINFETTDGQGREIVKKTDYEGQQKRIKEINEWIDEANKRIPPMEIHLGEGCQDAIDFCHVPGMQETMRAKLEKNRAIVQQYNEQVKEVTKYEKEKTGLKNTTDRDLKEIKETKIETTDYKTVAVDAAKVESELKTITADLTKIEDRRKELAQAKGRLLILANQSANEKDRPGKPDVIKYYSEELRKLDEMDSILKIQFNAAKTKMDNLQTAVNNIGDHIVKTAALEKFDDLAPDANAKKSAIEQQQTKWQGKRQEFVTNVQQKIGPVAQRLAEEKAVRDKEKKAQEAKEAKESKASRPT